MDDLSLAQISIFVVASFLASLFQPVGVTIFILTGLWLGGTGFVDVQTFRLFLAGLPAVLVGAWLGIKLFARLEETGFRKLVLVLLSASGAALLF